MRIKKTNMYSGEFRGVSSIFQEHRLFLETFPSDGLEEEEGDLVIPSVLDHTPRYGRLNKRHHGKNFRPNDFYLLRHELGVSQRWIAERAGVSVMRVCTLELGKSVRGKAVISIAQVLLAACRTLPTKITQEGHRVTM